MADRDRTGDAATDTGSDMSGSGQSAITRHHVATSLDVLGPPQKPPPTCQHNARSAKQHSCIGNTLLEPNTGRLDNVSTTRDIPNADSIYVFSPDSVPPPLLSNPALCTRTDGVKFGQHVVHIAGHVASAMPDISQEGPSNVGKNQLPRC